MSKISCLAGLVLAAALVSGCTVNSSGVVAAPSPQSAACDQAARFSVVTEKLNVTTDDGRDVPFDVVRPDRPGSYPLIIFSHGAFSSPDRYAAMLSPIAAAGYIIIAPMHVDSEKMEREKPASQSETWSMRGEDMVLALSIPGPISSHLSERKIKIDASRIATMGHSYGALMAQLSAGARAGLPTTAVLDPRVKAVIAYSPPGALPPMMMQSGWSTLSSPSLTLTGTADILPGFIDDWEVHRQSFDNAPQGNRMLWVGEGIDHYFGGIFGREKPADENSKRLFARSIATSISFLDRYLAVEKPCVLGSQLAGETLIKD